MEKVWKKVKVLITLAIVIVIALISFVGIYKKENGVWKNVVSDYELGMDIEGTRELVFTLDDSEEEKYVYVDEDGNIKGEVWEDGSSITEEHEQEHEAEEAEAETTDETEDTEVSEDTTEDETTDEETTDETSEEEESEEVSYAKETRTVQANPTEQMTKENFEKAKKIIQERLSEQGIEEYSIRVDDVTGKLVIETTNDDDNIELIEELITEPGKFEIIDYQNGVVLMDNSDIKEASVVYSSDSSYSTYLQIEFTKSGSEKLREMSLEYVETTVESEETAEEVTDETSEEETTEEEVTNEDTTEEEEEETETKYVSIVFDDTTLMTTYFGEEMTNGMIQISVGDSTTDYDEFVENYNSAKSIADVLNSGVLPVDYELEKDNFVKSEITTGSQRTFKIVVAIVVLVISVIEIIRYRKNGVISAILNIGYIAILSLLLRYTNVEISINSIIAGCIMVLVNYGFTFMILNKLKTEEISQAYKQVSKKFYLMMIPVIVIAFVFTLASNMTVVGIGGVVFWAIVLNAIYNLIYLMVFKK